MPSNEFLPWALGSGANVESQSAYAANAARTSGVESGTATSDLYNKAQRQATFMAVVLATMIYDQLDIDVPDDGDIAAMVTKLQDAILQVVSVEGFATVAELSNEAEIRAAADSALQTLKAPIESPLFTGDPRAPTPTAGDNDTSVATTAFVHGAVSGLASETYVNAALSPLAPKANPSLTGNVGVPTRTLNDNTDNAASTRFVQTAISNAFLTYSSPIFAMSAAQYGQYTHGIADVSGFVMAELVLFCTSSDLGFSNGDVVPLTVASSGSGTGRGFTVGYNATYAFWSRDGNSIDIQEKTGGQGTINLSKWNGQIRMLVSH